MSTSADRRATGQTGTLDSGTAQLFTAQREAEWGEFVSDCGKYETELAGEIAKGKLTLAELDEEEQSLDRLRHWYRTIRARHLFGAPSAPVAERRLKECTEALEDVAERVYQARERPGPVARRAPVRGRPAPETGVKARARGPRHRRLRAARPNRWHRRLTPLSRSAWCSRA